MVEVAKVVEMVEVGKVVEVANVVEIIELGKVVEMVEVIEPIVAAVMNGVESVVESDDFVTKLSQLLV
ncbi:unnamed protein product [Brachionus calyciflorus]|uniref:Uncharacterized protein n=1 Tax=Brachionus calyciflorus TaxID=104777 RepID=A0A814SI56_9BILA|nr:unnamed protein product [Brachionus calyciflorus]